MQVCSLHYLSIEYFFNSFHHYYDHQQVQHQLQDLGEMFQGRVRSQVRNSFFPSLVRTATISPQEKNISKAYFNANFSPGNAEETETAQQIENVTGHKFRLGSECISCIFCGQG